MVPYAVSKNIRYSVYVVIFFIALVVRKPIADLLGLGGFSSEVTLGAILTGLFIIFDRIGWATLNPFGLGIVPDIRGIWYGAIGNREEFLEVEAGYIKKTSDYIPARMDVEQTFSELGITFFSQANFAADGMSLKSPPSRCTMAALEISNVYRPRLSYTFQKDDLIGSVELELLTDELGSTLVGNYFSNKQRNGDIKLRKLRSSRSRVMLMKCARLPVGNPNYLGCIIPAEIVSDYVTVAKKAIGGRKFRGYARCKAERDANALHMTIIEPSEYEALISDETKRATLGSLEQTRLFIELIAVGLQRDIRGEGECVYVVCRSPAADEIRDRFSLKKKHFHITLGFDRIDLHLVDKGINTIVRHPRIYRAGHIFNQLTRQDK